MKKLNKVINVLIVDDHHLILEGLQSLLSEEPGIRLIDGVSSGDDALEVIRSEHVDVVLADINMPEMSGIELTRKIRENFPSTKVIALTMHTDNTLIAQMIEAGASGYLLKSTNISELCDAIFSVSRGQNYLSSEVQLLIMKGIIQNKSFSEYLSDGTIRFSTREAEILKLIVNKLTQEEIAGKLFMGKRTVETHLKNIFIKTRTKSLSELTKFARDKKLIPCE
jgi:DNA-binding NarL/FixJ family response regulator